MLELHQFRHSAFCLKVRMALQSKGLSFREVEVTPGIGQIAVFRLSGQRQVPVLVDGDHVVADSSAICRHLETLEPAPALIPMEPRLRAQVELIEDWADTTLAAAARAALLQAAVDDPLLRDALLPPLEPVTDASDLLRLEVEPVVWSAASERHTRTQDELERLLDAVSHHELQLLRLHSGRAADRAGKLGGYTL